MKILIGYDGSRCAEAALGELAKAALPETVEAKLISIAEVWIPPNASFSVDENGGPRREKDERWRQQYDEAVKHAVTETETMCRHAKDRLRRSFPKWRISSAVTFGSPSGGILAAADDFNPDLIVVGSQGKTAVSRVLLGSISRKVFFEANCSVRISRSRPESCDSFLHQIIAYDGSPGSDRVVEAVTKRRWQDDAGFKLVLVSNPDVPREISRFMPPTVKMLADQKTIEQIWVDHISATALKNLAAANLNVKVAVNAGIPKQILTEEAEYSNAGCIFIGAHSYNQNGERSTIGCTAAAVAERAVCSVEVVR